MSLQRSIREHFEALDTVELTKYSSPILSTLKRSKKPVVLTRYHGHTLFDGRYRARVDVLILLEPSSINIDSDEIEDLENMLIDELYKVPEVALPELLSSNVVYDFKFSKKDMQEYIAITIPVLGS